MQEMTKDELQTAYETLNVLYRSLAEEHENTKKENKMLRRKLNVKQS